MAELENLSKVTSNAYKGFND